MSPTARNIKIHTTFGEGLACEVSCWNQESFLVEVKGVGDIGSEKMRRRPQSVNICSFSGEGGDGAELDWQLSGLMPEAVGVHMKYLSDSPRSFSLAVGTRPTFLPVDELSQTLSFRIAISGSTRGREPLIPVLRGNLYSRRLLIIL